MIKFIRFDPNDLIIWFLYLNYFRENEKLIEKKFSEDDIEKITK